MKLIDIEIVEGARTQWLGKHTSPEHIVTTVRLVYKKRFSKKLIFKEAYSDGTYQKRDEKFHYFNFIDKLGEKFDDEICEKISNFLDKERIAGNLVITKKSE